MPGPVVRVRWRRIPPTRSRATAWPVRPVAPPCRRDGGPVGDVAVPGFPGPRVAALAPASRRLRCPFSMGYWQVSAQIYLGCTFGGPSIDLGWRLQWSPRAGLQLAARRRPAAGGSVRCRRLARVGPVPGAPRVPRRQARLGARGQGTDGPGASRVRGPASDYASGPVLFHPRAGCRKRTQSRIFWHENDDTAKSEPRGLIACHHADPGGVTPCGRSGEVATRSPSIAPVRDIRHRRPVNWRWTYPNAAETGNGR